jgi:hypothetical protein
LLDHIFLECNSGVGNIKNYGERYRDNENEEKQSEKNFRPPVEKEECQYYECDNHIGVFLDVIYYIRHHVHSPHRPFLLVLPY